MSKPSDRKVIGRYAAGKPRKVRFSGQSGPMETDCLTDIVRDLLAIRVNTTVIDGKRARVEWTPSDLARELGMPLSTLSAILNGDREPSLHHLERIAARAKCSVLEVILMHSNFIPQSIVDDYRAGLNPLADLRYRANLSDEQRERVGLALEKVSAAQKTQELVDIVETFADAVRD